MKYLHEILFLIVVLLSNIIQGITGFAGTVLAMPFSVRLVGFNTAKPILNVLGLLSGIYVMATSYRSVNKKEFLKITLVMIGGIAVGLVLKNRLAGKPELLYIILGVVVTAVGASGLVKSFRKKAVPAKQNPVFSWILLIVSGIVHGLFVCGGPLLVSYLTGRTRSKDEFRATLSGVWIVLNGVILADDLRTGLFSAPTVRLLIPSAAVLFAGMFLGSVLYHRMSRETFMKITFVLLIVSGISLFVK